MQEMKMPENLLKKITYHSETCNKHVKPTKMMIIDGIPVCPKCELEQEQRKFEENVQQEIKQAMLNKKYNTLYNRSILQDNTLLNATLDNYVVTQQEETKNKLMVIKSIEHYRDGETFNLILQGNQGAGKSHLAYATLRELNSLETSCLFVNVESMLRLIKDSFSNRESKYTENYFIELMSEVDYLVLDDIGAETGAIDTDKTATDFVQRVLYAITTTRQDKSTIITTNLKGETLFKMYDRKLVSRLFKKPKYIMFNATKDKRMNDIPF